MANIPPSESMTDAIVFRNHQSLSLVNQRCASKKAAAITEIFRSDLDHETTTATDHSILFPLKAGESADSKSNASVQKHANFSIGDLRFHRSEQRLHLRRRSTKIRRMTSAACFQIPNIVCRRTLTQNRQFFCGSAI